MTREHWLDIREKIISQFSVSDEYEEDLDPGKAEVIEFETPQGILKASFETKPKVIGKKTLYSHRAGGDVKVDYDYSQNEEVCHLALYRWDEAHDEWVSLNTSSFFG